MFLEHGGCHITRLDGRLGPLNKSSSSSAKQLPVGALAGQAVSVLRVGEPARASAPVLSTADRAVIMRTLYHKMMAHVHHLPDWVRHAMTQTVWGQRNAPSLAGQYVRHRLKATRIKIRSGVMVSVLRSPDSSVVHHGSLQGMHRLKTQGLMRVKVSQSPEGQYMMSYRLLSDHTRLIRVPIRDMSTILLSQYPFFIDASPLFQDAVSACMMDDQTIGGVLDSLVQHMPSLIQCADQQGGIPLYASVLCQGERITMGIGSWSVLKSVHAYSTDTLALLTPLHGEGIDRAQRAERLPPTPPRLVGELLTALRQKIAALGQDKAGYTAGLVDGLIARCTQLDQERSLVSQLIVSLLPDWIGVMGQYLDALDGESLSTRDASDQFEQFAACALVCAHLMEAALPSSGVLPVDTLKGCIRQSLGVPPGIDTSVELTNFAMTSWHQVLHRVLTMWRPFVGDHLLTYSMPDHTYFELKPPRLPRWVTRCSGGPASIMVVSFAPNNVTASSAICDLNALKADIRTQLGVHATQGHGIPVVLVVDTSTQVLYPSELHDVLTTFAHDIQDQQLIVMQLVSMAKFLQLGLDRASGGLLVTYSAPFNPQGEQGDTVGGTMLRALHNPAKQPPPLSDLAARFFAFLLPHCRDDLARYHQDVVRYTNETHLSLLRMSRRSNMIWTVQPKSDGVPVIGLRLKSAGLPDGINSEFLTKGVWQYLLYQLRGIPIEARQSIGLLNSQLTMCAGAIRLVVGAMSSSSDRLTMTEVLSRLVLPPVSDTRFWNWLNRASQAHPTHMDRPRWDAFPTPDGVSLKAFLSYILPDERAGYVGEDGQRPAKRTRY